MPGYVGLKKKKNRLGVTLLIVAAVHLAAAGALIWLASTTVGREMIALYKIKMHSTAEPEAAPKPEPAKPEPKKPEPEPEPQAEPEAAPEPAEVPVAEAPPAPAIEPPAAAVEAPPPAPAEAVNLPVRLPSSGNPFAANPGRKFAGYVDLVTSEIQRFYKQPPGMPANLRKPVQLSLVLDEDGRLLRYDLVGSSGSPAFDQSALQAIAAVKRLRPPPKEMSRTIVVKFHPPS
jgi:TonB family protein